MVGCPLDGPGAADAGCGSVDVGEVLVEKTLFGSVGLAEDLFLLVAVVDEGGGGVVDPPAVVCVSEGDGGCRYGGAVWHAVSGSQRVVCVIRGGCSGCEGAEAVWVVVGVGEE